MSVLDDLAAERDAGFSHFLDNSEYGLVILIVAIILTWLPMIIARIRLGKYHWRILGLNIGVVATNFLPSHFTWLWWLSLSLWLAALVWAFRAPRQITP